MSLDLSRLERPRFHGGKVIARCPACAELGADKSCEHLFVANDGCGAFGCIAYVGAHGADHRKRIWELAGSFANVPTHPPGPLVRPSPPRSALPLIPSLRPLDVAEMAQIAHLRGWQYFAGLQLLADRGLLHYADVFDAGRTWPAWMVTDSSRRNAQARRLDGQLWLRHEAKAKTLPGCDPSWPIGCAEIGERPFVLLCEGQPDFAASLLVAWWEGTDVAPICMTGAGNTIHAESLPLFAGKHVRIAVHADPNGKGQEAGKRWARQLYAGGAERVDYFDFAGLTKEDGLPVKDLADYATLLSPDLPPSVSVLAESVMEMGGQSNDQA